jgi:hypothetical protein
MSFPTTAPYPILTLFLKSSNVSSKNAYAHILIPSTLLHPSNLLTAAFILPKLPLFQNDLLLSANKQKTSALILLDVSAAFDTIDHSFLDSLPFMAFLALHLILFALTSLTVLNLLY